MNKKKLIPALLGTAAAMPADAARPMITDDARIVDPKACQVESWVKRNPDSTEFWAIPACNPTGNLELTFGGALTREHGETLFTDNVLQGKTIFRALEPNGWGAGLAVGMLRHPHREAASGWGDPYFYVPVSVAFRGDQWVVHVNAGAIRQRAEDRTLGTWGLGNEIRLRPDLYFIPEVFGNDRGRPFYQVGLRKWIVPDRVQVDATFGNRFTSESGERWMSIGLRLLSPPFLP